jgi:hypothetical protein
MFKISFWSYSGERAIKTFAQTAIAMIGTNSVGLFDLNWLSIIGVSGTAALLSILTSIVSVNTTNPNL